MGKLLPGRSWIPALIIGVSEGRKGEGSVHKPFQATGGAQATSRSRMIRCLTLGQQLEKYAVQPLPGKTGILVFLPVPSVLNPGLQTV